ncbi:MAG TPA: cysteine--tRNA ligase [Candidatus Paceibacterota bacterium]
MDIHLYNTLTRKKDLLSPITPNNVKIYTCGLTVYDYAHIGNLRSYIFADTLHRTLANTDLEVEQIENITDVGHLVGDGDEGEDKMDVGVRKTGKSAWEIAELFTDAFKHDRNALNILPPTKWIKATDTIQEQIDFIKELETKGYTYKINDGIYFDTSKLSDYGKLAQLDIAGLREGARIVFNKEKRKATDFALWKLSPASINGKKRDMEWESPWGIGFPGWHIECSAMSRKFLGFPFDIHTGGIDHVPVHHTNEIAQNEACCDSTGANIWMHNEHLLVDGKKMSKSLGNFYILSDIVEKGYSPLAFRYLCLCTHYRQKLNFTWEALESAQISLNKLVRALATQVDTPLGHPVSKLLEVMTDDLNTPQALASIWESLNSGKNIDIEFVDKLLGLSLSDQIVNYKELQTNIPDEVRKLIDAREKARLGKDWGKADDLRAQIEKLGWKVMDKTEGPELEPLC